MRENVKILFSVRMDSKLIGSNIACQSRYEPIHTTLVKFLKANGLSRLSAEQQEQAKAYLGENSSKTRNGKTRYRGLLKHRIHAYSRCMWMNLRKIVIFQISTFQRPIFALYEPLRETFYWLELFFTNKIRIPVVSYVSLEMSANDKTEYQNLCKTATF